MRQCLFPLSKLVYQRILPNFFSVRSGVIKILGLVYQNQTWLFLKSGNISLYVAAFIFPIIKKSLLYLINCAIYSLNKLKGGLVIIISDSWSSLTHSSERKSPLPRSLVLVSLLLLSNSVL